MQETQIAKKKTTRNETLIVLKNENKILSKGNFKFQIANCKRAREEEEKESDGG
jgi:hypothetical protein